MKLKTINIAGNQIQLGNLNVIVGPNGVGKTTLLSNLYENLIQAQSQNNQKWGQLLNNDSLEIIDSEMKKWIESLCVVQGQAYGNYKHYYADPRSLLGNKSSNSFFITDDELPVLKNYFFNANQSQQLNPFVMTKARKSFVYQHTAYLKVDDRFYLSQSSSGPLNLKNNNILNVAPYLASHKDILTSINSHIAKIFNKKLFPESQASWNFDLYTAPNGTKPPKRFTNMPENYAKITEAIVKWANTNNATLINQEGHGIRAATQVLFDLKNSINELIIIDEPELHLYPSAKYKLGQIIAKLAKNKNKQIILVTHDSDMLRGIIENNKSATIIRIDSGRNVHYIQSDKIRQTTTPEALQATFSSYAIITEGIQDAYVYEGAILHNNFFSESSMRMIPANGKENVANDFYFYQALGIKYAAIFDFDVIYSKHKRNTKKVQTLKKAVKQLRLSDDITQDIFQKIDDVTALLEGQANKRYGLRNEYLTQNDRAKIESLLQKLRNFGIFICPFGALEDWVGTDKQNSTPETILRKYKSRCRTLYAPLTDFLRDISIFLQQ